MNRIIVPLILAEGRKYHGKYNHKAKYREGNLQESCASFALYFSRFVLFIVL